MTQTNKNSLYESIIQALSGVILGFLIQKFVFPYMGILFTNEQNIKAVIIFFIASLCRQYIIRRMFNLNLKYYMKLYIRTVKEYYLGVILFIKYMFSYINKKNVKKIDYEFLKNIILKAKKDVKTKFYKKIIVMFLKRHKMPYKPENFTKAKKLFEEFKIKNAIKSIYQVNNGDYLFIIDTDYPIKGEHFCSYYISSHSFNEKRRIFQVKDIDINSESVSNGENEFYRNVQQCRFATSEEIEAKKDNDLEKELLQAIKDLPRRNFK